MQRDLELAAGAGKRVGEQQLLGVPVKPPHGIDQHFRRDQSQAHPALGQPGLRAASLGQFGGHFLSARVKGGEVVAVGGDEASGLAHRVGSRVAGAVFLQGGQRELFARMGGVEPQERFGNAGKAGGDVGDLQPGQVDIGEQWITQHFGKATGVILGVFRRKVRHVEPVRPRNPQQQFGGEGPLVAFEQRDIAGRDPQFVSHHLLGQAKVPAQAAQARAEIEGFGAAHNAILSRSYNFTSFVCKV